LADVHAYLPNASFAPVVAFLQSVLGAVTHAPFEDEVHPVLRASAKAIGS